MEDSYVTHMVLLLLASSISTIDGTCSICSSYSGFQNINYLTSNDMIENPGRGFYEHLETKASSFTHLTVHHLDNLRHSNHVNLALRVDILDSYVHSPLSTHFLQQVKTDMEILRNAGWTAVLRFSYINTMRPSAPYGDATKSIIIQHIHQLSPIWHQFQDIISLIQAGFIGTWGEWYYTTYFGDPLYPDDHGFHGISLQHWQDRKDVVFAILNAAPSTISVQLRTPAYKQHILGTDATNTADVSKANPKSRTGHFNDCFLQSDTDVRTYSNIQKDKAYLARDSMFVPVGGETCGRSQGTTRSDCPTALKELREFHWSFINRYYHPDVLGDWKKHGCYDDIKKQLGYRIRLVQVELPKTINRGQHMCYKIQLENIGFAAPYKDWLGILVMHHIETGRYYNATMSDIHSRSWLPGHHAFQGALTVPSSLPIGQYDMYIGFVEKASEHDVNLYILLANKNVPDSSIGPNSLQAAIQVRSGSSISTTCHSFTSWSLPPRSRYARITKQSGSQCKPIVVPNGSFETNDNSWQKYGNRFVYDSTTAVDGHRSLKVTNGGASQTFIFSHPTTAFTITAYSKYIGVSKAKSSDYSLYCDLQTADGTNVWGQNTPFSTQDTNWHNVTLSVHEPKGIHETTCYVLYRNQGSGEAYFDEINLMNCDN